MAGTIIGASPAIDILQAQSLGFAGVSLSNFANTSEPQVNGTVECAGSIIEFTNESITGWSSVSVSTDTWIKIVPDTGAGTAALEFTTIDPAWDDSKAGWYSPTAGEENQRYIAGVYKDSSGDYAKKYLIEDESGALKRYGDGTTDQDSIDRGSLYHSQENIKHKIVEGTLTTSTTFAVTHGISNAKTDRRIVSYTIWAIYDSSGNRVQLYPTQGYITDTTIYCSVSAGTISGNYSDIYFVIDYI